MEQIKYTKRIGHLYEKIADIENIKLAIRNASKRKRNRPSVRRILSDIDTYAKKIKDMLDNESFVPHPYTIREINDGIKKKKRIIAVSEVLSGSVHTPRIRPGFQRNCRA